VARTCALPPRAATRRERIVAFLACRRCAVGWAVYLAVAILIVALSGAR
jgi:hypothetical protein